MNAKRDTKKDISSLISVVKVPFICAPLYTALWVAKGLLYALLAYLQVLLFARFTDAVLRSLRGGGGDLGPAMGPACALAAVLVAQQLAPQLDRLLNVFLTTAVRETFGLRLMDKLSKVDYPCIEDAETENLIYRVNDQPEQKVTAAFQNLLSMAQT